MGYTGLKFDVFGSYYDYIDEKGLQLAYDRVKAVRDATGGNVDLMIEHHGRFNPNSAIMIANKLEELDPLFMEEPIHPDNLAGIQKISRATNVRVALGERLLTKEQVVEVLQNNLTDFLQVDLTNVGGVTVARKVSAIAEAYGVEMAFHNAFRPDPECSDDSSRCVHSQLSDSGIFLGCVSGMEEKTCERSGKSGIRLRRGPEKAGDWSRCG